MAVKKIPKNINFDEVFKYGVELSKICSSKLDKVKQEVEKIIRDDEAEDGYRLEKFRDMEAE